MSIQRANEIVAQLGSVVEKLRWLRDVKHVFLAGGLAYQRVMRAAIDCLKTNGILSPDVAIESTHGGLGYQRAQLGTYLRSIPDSPKTVGHHDSGTPCLSHAWGYTVGQTVVLQRSPQEKATGVIRELFFGPGGPTAAIMTAENNPSKFESCAWVGIHNIAPPDPFCLRMSNLC